MGGQRPNNSKYSSVLSDEPTMPLELDESVISQDQQQQQQQQQQYVHVESPQTIQGHVQAPQQPAVAQPVPSQLPYYYVQQQQQQQQQQQSVGQVPQQQQQQYIPVQPQYIPAQPQYAQPGYPGAQAQAPVPVAQPVQPAQPPRPLTESELKVAELAAIEYNHDIQAWFGQGWAFMRLHMLKTLVPVLMFLLASMLLFGVLMAFLFSGDHPPHPAALIVTHIIGTIAGIAIQTMLIAGFYTAVTKYSRGEEVLCRDFCDGHKVVNGFKKPYHNALIQKVVVSVGFLLFFVPGVYAAVASLYAVPLAIEFPVLDTFKGTFMASAKQVHKKFFQQLGFVIVLIIVNVIAGIFTWGFGLLFTIPFTIVVMLFAFQDIFNVSGRIENPEAKAMEHRENRRVARLAARQARLAAHQAEVERQRAMQQQQQAAYAAQMQQQQQQYAQQYAHLVQQSQQQQQQLYPQQQQQQQQQPMTGFAYAQQPQYVHVPQTASEQFQPTYKTPTSQ